MRAAEIVTVLKRILADITRIRLVAFAWLKQQPIPKELIYAV
jgi:hypothetical protein